MWFIETIIVFFLNDTESTEIYTFCHTLSLHDALPISRFAQDARGGEAAAVAKTRHAHLDQHDAAECGDQPARVVARLDPHRAGAFLIQEGVERDRRLDRKSTRLNSSH